MNLKRILFSQRLFMLSLAFTLMFEVKAGESQQKWNATLLVQDYARVFSPVQLDSLESKLSGFAMAASIELVIRTESSIGNSELLEFAIKQTDKMNFANYQPNYRSFI
ncbi:MAG: TPM domain-containing protein [Bacteroidetes bacterium]|nr:TPM domain-containing protein [Bacteroidota bacterium]